jgi:hypothetical protein
MSEACRAMTRANEARPTWKSRQAQVARRVPCAERREDLGESIHRVAQRRDRRCGLTCQRVDLLQQQVALLDELTSGIPRVFGSPSYFRRHHRAREQVLPNTRGQIGMTARAEMRAVIEEVGGEALFPEALPTDLALRDLVLPAELEEQRPLLIGQVTRSMTVEMDDLVSIECNGLVRGEPSTTARTLESIHVCTTRPSP